MNNTSSSREALILGQLYQIDFIVARMRHRVPTYVRTEDLVSIGTVGLIQAVDRFDPSRGVKLKTFAERRIRGAILDYMRREDPMPRNERREAKCGDRSPLQIESVDRFIATHDRSLPVATEPSPLEQAHNAEIRVRLAKAMAILTATERRILSLHFVDGLKKAAIARRTGLSYWRICRDFESAISKLRSALSGQFGKSAAGRRDLR